MPDRPLLRRRTAVLGLAATALVTGCDHGDDIGRSAPSASPGRRRTPSPSPAEKTPDQALVDSAVAELSSAGAVLVAARRFTSLRQPLAPLLKAHRRHVEVLDGGLGGGVAPTLTDAASALQAVRHRERQLQAWLVDAAGRAESGALARLLASMSASVTQYVAVLPAGVAA